MNSLYEYTLKKLDQNFATRNIRSKVDALPNNLDFSEHICTMTKQLCESEGLTYDDAINYFIEFSFEFLKLQIELDKTGKYKYSSFKEVQSIVYDEPAVMEKRYLFGLLLSQCFWINHYKIITFFKDTFCANVHTRGSILEVPVGTGIFIAEFMKMNKQWNAKAYDLSESSVHFSKKILAQYGISSVIVAKKNVFAMPESEKFDSIICGELLEHLENPQELLHKLSLLVKDDGKIFLTTAIWAASIDHLYLFKSAQEVRDMLQEYFTIESELVLNVFSHKSPEDEKTPINYACVLSKKAHKKSERDTR